ncbi:MAG: hypothetical protein JO290_08555 [Sphingomonadaceae bacterium]|nr:hypothetical protein [Sphingomonadaceae bacterium]
MGPLTAARLFVATKLAHLLGFAPPATKGQSGATGRRTTGVGNRLRQLAQYRPKALRVTSTSVPARSATLPLSAARPQRGAAVAGLKACSAGEQPPRARNAPLAPSAPGIATLARHQPAADAALLSAWEAEKASRDAAPSPVTEEARTAVMTSLLPYLGKHQWATDALDRLISAGPFGHLRRSRPYQPPVAPAADGDDNDDGDDDLTSPFRNRPKG